MSIEDLQLKRKALKENSEITLCNMQKLTDESSRVAMVAHNARETLDNLDLEFESQTGLQGKDITFLFTAVGLQLARIAIINDITRIEKAGSNNRNETKLHEFQDKLLGKFDTGEPQFEYPYYASLEHILTKPGVPYDATAPLTEKAVQGLIGKDREWSFNIQEYIPTEKNQLFKGANHRFATLGHDPVLGLLFGTSNIMTNTITCVRMSGEVNVVPILTTNHVVYTSDFKDPRIATHGSTLTMLRQTMKRIESQSSAFVAAMIKQIIHIGTDLYTPCGIQLPAANLLLTNTEVEELTHYINAGDIIKVGVSEKFAELINLIISTVHTLMYDPDGSVSRDVYNVRTRKIITYSNLIATGSHTICASINANIGDISALRNLDIGGMMALLKRLREDSEYTRKIKEEFVIGEFNKLIQGEELCLQEPDWTAFNS